MILLLICAIGSADCRVLKHYDRYSVCERVGKSLAQRFDSDFTCTIRQLIVTDKRDPNHVWRFE